MRSFLFSVLLVCSLIVVPSSVWALESLTVLQPTSLAQHYASTNGEVTQRPSLFGLPNFRSAVAGQVIYPEAPQNRFGCNSYQPFNSGDGGSSDTLIALIDRGNCTFAQKVLHAQDAGAQAAIIVNDDATYGTFLPFLAAGSDGQSIHIPAMIIHSADGDLFKQNINNAGGLFVSMNYFIPNDDDRVEVDFYTTAADPLSATFRKQFSQVANSLGSHMLFEPHYQIFNGGYAFTCTLTGTSCTKANLDNRCGNRCINCGRYCANDPDGNITSAASGSDVILEQLRAKCVWQYGNDTKFGANTYWFDYVNRYDTACANSPKYDSQCSLNLIQQLGVPTSYLTTCMGNPGYTTDSAIPILDSDRSFMTAYSPLPPPQLFVNQQSYHGSLTCPTPLGTNCPALQMICAGYADGTAPITCQTSPGCDLGVLVDSCEICGGDNSTCVGCDGVVKSGMERDACGDCLSPKNASFVTDKSFCPAETVIVDGGGSKSSFPVGAVIGIILGACLLIGIGVFFYMRRQNDKMKDDIDSLLKAYLPMDDGANSTQRSNVDRTRLIGSDREPADL